ncbi:hypothetical protein ABFP60_01580 [Clostridioides difficile]
MRKKGNILVETIVGVNIILSMFLIVTLLISENKKTEIYRRSIEEGHRVIYSVMEEIKYNITMEEILNLTNTDNLALEYHSDFLKDLCNKSLLNMPNGDGVIISATKTEDVDKVYISIKVNLDHKGNVLENTFIKYKWMEYYERT